MEKELFSDIKLFTPGPTPIPLRVKAAPLLNDIYHRSDDYYQMHRACQTMLAPFFGTKQTPIILTSSGTGAMEAAVIHCTNPNDSVLVLKVGKFGERFEKISKAYGCQVDCLATENGTAVTLDMLREKLAATKSLNALMLQANETSTGSFNPISELIPEVKKKFPHAWIIVDGISALCAHEIAMDKLGIDVVISGSQKGFGVPPGLSFIALSARAETFRSSRPRFYFDLTKELGEQKNGRTAFTPAISVVQSLHASLTELSQHGAQKIINHHARLTHSVRNAATALGLKPFIKANYSQALTSIVAPPNVDAAKVLKIAKEKFGCVISGGQDELKGKIFRFAHLGMTSSLHTLQGLAAFEFSLRDCGYQFELGKGVAAAMETLASS